MVFSPLSLVSVILPPAKHEHEVVLMYILSIYIHISLSVSKLSTFTAPVLFCLSSPYFKTCFSVMLSCVVVFLLNIKVFMFQKKASHEHQYRNMINTHEKGRGT